MIQDFASIMPSIGSWQHRKGSERETRSTIARRGSISEHSSSREIQPVRYAGEIPAQSSITLFHDQEEGRTSIQGIFRPVAGDATQQRRPVKMEDSGTNSDE